MDEATLEGCREKVGRAEELLREIDDRWQAFLNTNPYPAWVEANDDTGCHIVWFDFSTRTPLVLPVILGEFAHDLRSALDQLAWREAVEFVGRPLTKKEARQISFPLSEKRADFLTASVKPYVSKDAWALMECHQPYKRGKGRGPKTLGHLAGSTTKTSTALGTSQRLRLHPATFRTFSHGTAQAARPSPCAKRRRG